MQRKNSLNMLYGAVQGLYWMGICVCINFAALFLQSGGYSNSELGIIMAFGNVAGFVISPLLASVVDSSKRITLYHCLWVLLAVQALCLAFFAFFPSRSLPLSLLYCLYMGCVIAVNPLNTQMCTELEQLCGGINYGAARGVGSVSFSAMALVMGLLTKKYGASVLPLSGLVSVFAQGGVLYVITRRTGMRPTAAQPQRSGDQAASLAGFIRGNGRFCVLMLGIAMLFFSCNLSNNFLINIARNVGGDEASLGGINAFMALTEVPVMFLYDRMARKIGCPATIRIAAAAFVAKALGIALAGSVPALYAAHALQALSFAVITPAMVRYVNLYISSKDSAKGQSISYNMTTLGSIFASCLGGVMFDSMSVRAALLTGTAVAAVGAAVCLAFARPADRS